MKFEQKWEGTRVIDGESKEYFPATVPGDIQLDYAKSIGIGDVNWADNALKFKEFEDYGWIYRTNIEYTADKDDKVFFVTEGIEYEYDIYLNSKKLMHHEGMFSRVEIDITKELLGGNLLEIYIYPHPKRPGAAEDREQADQSCKPAVCYGWDWHPRLLVSGIWNETYIETRNSETIVSCIPSYTMSEDMKSADVHFDTDCESDVFYEVYDADGKTVYQGQDNSFCLQNVNLWWCNGQGEPYLYKWRAKSNTDKKEGYIGFRRIRLVMHDGAWQYPPGFPKSRSNPPMTIELNGRKIFAKGSNWVNPEIFTGTITGERYEELITLAKDANMNILRCWGGACVDKEPFFEICDRLGIMVWQEFPLACNHYTGTEKYLKVLEQEAIAIISRLKSHPCLALWCGGNELFNGAAKMTDQSYALRLLDKLCFENDRTTPFIMTAPLSGMAHGPYVFYDFREDKNVMDLFIGRQATAYSEFGVTSITELEHLKKIIPEDILYNPQPNSPWELHHGYGAWIYAGKDTWLGFSIMDIIFGKQATLEDYIEKSIWLQCEGLKFIFEEARRQKPFCSMALNWCYNEPWITAAGLSIITYPNHPKKAYYVIKNSLKNVIPSARIAKFQYEENETVVAELWLLNDSNETVSDDIDVYYEADGERRHVLTWHTGDVAPNENKKGHKVQIEIGQPKGNEIKLILKAKCGENSYRLLYRTDDANKLPEKW